MIVYYLYFFRADFRPNEADAVAIVDTDAMLTLSVTTQRLELVARRYLELAQRNDRIKEVNLSSRYSPQALRARLASGPCTRSVENVFSASIPEGLYHINMITWVSCYFQGARFRGVPPH